MKRWLRHDEWVGRRDQTDNHVMRLLLQLAMPSDANCVEVGVLDGEILDLIIHAAPSGHHIAYEPLPSLIPDLRQRFPNVDLRQAALSDQNGTSSFNYVRNLPGYSGLLQRNYPRVPDIEVIQVETRRLDDDLPPGYIPWLIKIDVEGAEGKVLEGARTTISTHRPIVLFEHGAAIAAGYGTSSRDVFRLLCDDCGLRIFDLEGDGPYSLDAFESVSGKWNFVAHR